ncbi:MAG: siderophore ABC transporter substrate-binding protein [Oscillospiraceae bacterium]
MKKLLSTILLFALFIPLTGCLNNEATPPSETVEVTHSKGTTNVPLKPTKVAVLDFAAIDIIDSLGSGGTIVGIPKQTPVTYLQSYFDNDNVENLGALKEVNMEKLVETTPELIVIGGRLESEYDNLSKIAPTIMINIDNEAGYLKSVTENIDIFSKIFGKEKESQKIINDFNDRVTALNKKAENQTAIVALVSKNSLSNLGKTSRASLISNEVGFNNLSDENIATHGEQSSFEFILSKNPRYIFLLDRDTAINANESKTAKEVMDNEIINKTDAFKEDKIVYLSPEAWYLGEGGVKATDIMISDLEKYIK